MDTGGSGCVLHHLVQLSIEQVEHSTCHREAIEGNLTQGGETCVKESIAGTGGRSKPVWMKRMRLPRKRSGLVLISHSKPRTALAVYVVSRAIPVSLITDITSSAIAPHATLFFLIFYSN